MDKEAISKLIRSPKDYWKIGPVYIWKWLALLLLGVLCAAIILLLGLPLGLFSGGGAGIPTYRYNDPDLQEISGTVRILDGQDVIRYEGEVSAGACTGNGKVYDAAGQLVYEGPLVDGVYEGADAKVYADGFLVYEGEMAQNLYEGQGRRIDPTTGNISEGQFVAGVFEGEGQEFFPDGTLLRSGTFARNLLNGEGQEYSEDGTLLRIGTFSDGLLHGTGTQYTASGALQYEGDFQFGIYHGQGKLYDTLLQALFYEGEFVWGEARGLGRIYHPSGQLLYEGQIYDEQTRADAFLGLSLAEVEEAFKEHWLLYTCDGVTAFVYPYFRLMFVTETPITLVSQTEQDELTEQERQELLEALARQAEPASGSGENAAPGTDTGGDAPPEDSGQMEEADTAGGTSDTVEVRITGVQYSASAGAVLSKQYGDKELSSEIDHKDIIITEVLSYGGPLPGTAQPETDTASGRHKLGWREWFSDYAAGEILLGAGALQIGPFVYEFTAFEMDEEQQIDYTLATGGGVTTTTVRRESKDLVLWYQSAVREDAS